MQALFHSIDTYLLQHQDFWRFEPFFVSQHSTLPWQQSHPALCQWLQDLSDDQVEHYKQDQNALVDAVAPFFPSMRELLAQLAMPSVTLSGLNLARGVDSGVPGRKLSQITAMGEAALQNHQGEEWLEWCSGKGFLGRILASQSRQKVTSLEYQAPLCQSGQLEADKQQLPMTFVQGDALSDEVEQIFNASQHAVALHACGDLHVSLLEKGVDHQLPAMTISPCCYHLIAGQQYRPLSSLAIDSTLKLSQSELRIPLQELVTGGERVKRHRWLEMSYRLGLDILLRQELGLDHYLPVPSIKKSQLADGFSAFCQWAAQHKGLTLPPCDFDAYWQQGSQRYWQMEKLSLIQQLFKRALELWLVLDKALYLEQNGYHVQVREFCRRDITPRNLLIQAQKSGTV
ncbi:hypothetical protein VII00023_07434 [Vibrio ichthyoenteri ATCC 700023]|uniref:Methyltransferase domain-containing protein n=1 Tax=Vibrio ichthyoenteri ATCC 700023 TaxID=870968 RepID=F9RYE3_9VIBR|nr:methyltransferase [Vibrio ichthyoenteri]EGU46748.1 hypothetical protein VII00023_07434 [Vibrio ichthyoenteri ATCC 700023]